MDWFRWHHGTVENSKWRVIARKSGQSIGNVIALWAALCERASQAEERGSVAGWSAEYLAASLDIEPEDILDIIAAMQAPGTDGQPRCIDGNILKGWTKYNPKREREEDSPSTDRVQKHREKKRQSVAAGVVTGDETPGNATKHQEEPGNTQIREEEIREEEESLRSSSGAARAEIAMGLADEVWLMVGVTPHAYRAAGKTADIEAVEGWLANGATAEEIREACKAKIGTGKSINSLWRFLAQTVPEAIDAVRAAASAPSGKPRDTAERQAWRLAVRLFTETGFWPEIKGDKPGLPGCMCPPDILADFNLKVAP